MDWFRRRRENGSRPKDPGRPEVGADADEDLDLRERRLRGAEQMGYREVYFPSHVGACQRCKSDLEGRTFTISEAWSLLREVIPSGQAGWCSQCENGYCRHVPLPVIDHEDPIADDNEYAERMAAVGLTDDVLEQVFSSSGQAEPRHEADLKIAMTWVESGTGPPPRLRWSWS
jgi:hypothetical protein